MIGDSKPLRACQGVNNSLSKDEGGSFGGGINTRARKKSKEAPAIVTWRGHELRIGAVAMKNKRGA